MNPTTRRLGLLTAVAAVVATAPARGQAPDAAQADAEPRTFAEDAQLAVNLPEESDTLRRMWNEMADLRLGSDARWADNTLIDDGVCRALFTNGIFVPVLSGGKGTVEERTVGAVYFGEGTLEMRFPDKGDAIAFANHMHLKAGVPRAELEPIVAGEAPWTSPFERGILLTADSQLDSILRRLDPVGGGVVDEGEVVTEARERGVDEVFVVTSSRGEFAAKALARNILPDRRRALQRSGMDPVSMLRFDRMLHDHFNVPWSQLRLLAEFKTPQRFHVAAPTAYVGDKSNDKWLTCFRDGLDHADSGLHSQAMAHGTDPDGRRNLVKFAGQRFSDLEGDGPGPPSRLRADDAEVEIELKPLKRSLYVAGTVKSKLEFEATEDGAQHMVLRLPRHEAIAGHFDLLKLETADGQPLQYLELGAGRATNFKEGSYDLSAARIVDNAANTNSSNAATGGGVSSSSGGGGLNSDTSLGAPDAVSGVSPGGDFVGIDETMQNATSFANDAVMGPVMDLLVMLPEPLAAGESIEIQLDWKARWQYANWSAVYGLQGGDGGEASSGFSVVSQWRPNGTTTGPRTFLPELLPLKGGTEWDFRVKVTVPPKRMDVAISGDTRNEWLDEGNWLWVESRGRDARRPAVSAGRWKFYEEQAANGLPGVRVHMFPSTGRAIEGFPSEVRRIFVFMKRFMPLPDFWEVEVFEGQSTVLRDTLTQARDLAPAGLVGVNKTLLGSGTTQSTYVEEAYPQLGRTQLARQVVSQVWGQLVAPASERDAWVHEALVEAFGYFYVRAALQEEGFEAFENRLEYVRESIERPVERPNNRDAVNSKIDGNRFFLSLTDGGSFATQKPKLFRAYSFYVLGRMLRERIGDQAFFRAIDRLGRRNEGRRITTEQLQAAFEEASGRDLSDFFHYWVRGGFVPKVTLEYAMVPQDDGKATVMGCVTTDVPFGRFDLPVVVGTGKLKKDIDNLDDLKKAGEDAVGGMINVIDGRGPFIVRDVDPEAKLVVDPFGLIVAYQRKAVELKETSCQKEGLH